MSLFEREHIWWVICVFRSQYCLLRGDRKRMDKLRRYDPFESSLRYSCYLWVKRKTGKHDTALLELLTLICFWSQAKERKQTWAPKLIFPIQYRALMSMSMQFRTSNMYIYVEYHKVPCKQYGDRDGHMTIRWGFGVTMPRGRLAEKREEQHETHAPVILGFW